MNRVDARAVPASGGWHGVFRKVHRAHWETVCLAGRPQLFASEGEAEIAAWRALRDHLQGPIYGGGERALIGSKSKAEELFGKIFPGRGKRPVEVVRR